MQPRLKLKEQKSKLDPFISKIAHWFEVEKATIDEVKERLGQLGLEVTRDWLGRWWQDRSIRLMRDKIFAQLALGSRQCRAVEDGFGDNPPPELETLIKLHRVLIMNYCAALAERPELIKLITLMMKPVMEWARLEEAKKAREFAESRFKEYLRTKLEAGLDQLAQHIKSDTGAREAYDNFKAAIGRITQ